MGGAFWRWRPRDLMMWGERGKVQGQHLGFWLQHGPEMGPPKVWGKAETSAWAMLKSRRQESSAVGCWVTHGWVWEGCGLLLHRCPQPGEVWPEAPGKGSSWRPSSCSCQSALKWPAGLGDWKVRVAWLLQTQLVWPKCCVLNN